MQVQILRVREPTNNSNPEIVSFWLLDTKPPVQAEEGYGDTELMHIEIEIENNVDSEDTGKVRSIKRSLSMKCKIIWALETDVLLIGMHSISHAATMQAS